MSADGSMKRDKRAKANTGEKPVFGEKEFIDYLEERFRKLRLDEQNFREEVLARNALLGKNPDYNKSIR